MFVLTDLFGVRCAGCNRPGAPLCSVCRRGLARPDSSEVYGLERVLAAFDYSGPARRLILDLKLTGLRSCAIPLAAGLVGEVMRRGLAADLVTWVPGRRADIRRRGFDHAAVIARSFAADVGLPAGTLIRRVRAARDQAGLTRLERFANLRGAFASRPCRGRIALVDDLLTTGATARACAAALQDAGASGVEVVVAARAGQEGRPET